VGEVGVEILIIRRLVVVGVMPKRRKDSEILLLGLNEKNYLGMHISTL